MGTVISEFWRRLARNRLLDISAVAFAMFGITHIALFEFQRPTYGDFSDYYLASRLTAEGRNPYRTPLKSLLEAPETQKEPNGESIVRQLLKWHEEDFGGAESPDGPAVSGYTPAFLFAFVPLTRLPVRVAYRIWLLGEVLCLTGIFWLTRRSLGDRLTARGGWFVIAAVLDSAAIYWHFHYAQSQLLLAAMVLAAYTCQREGRNAAACLLVAVAGLLKGFPFLILPWFVWKTGNGWRIRARYAMMTGVVIALAVVATGPGWWGDFFRLSVPPATAGATNRTFNYSLPTLAVNLGYAAYGFSPPLEARQLWQSIGSAVGLGVVVLAYFVCWRRSPDDETEFCLMCLAMLLGTLICRGDYLVFLIFPVAVLAADARRRSSWGVILFLAALWLVLNNVSTREGVFLDQHLYLKILVNDFPLYGLLALVWYFAARLLSNGVRTGRAGP